MRAIFEALPQAKKGEAGIIRVELARPGLPVLADERKFAIVDTPPARPSESKLTLPPFEVLPVDGPDDPKWLALVWPDDINAVASSSEMTGGKLTIYYSTVFPRFSATRSGLETRDPTKAASFVERYKIWLAVHSFLLYRDQEAAAVSEAGGHQAEEQLILDERREREERCRIAALSALFAAREVAQLGQASADEEA